MGNFQSKESQDGGFVTNSPNVSKKINNIYNDILEKYSKKLLNKDFCQKTKMFIRDDILMKSSNLEINQINPKLLVGVEYSDDVNKQKICDILSHHFLKKMNLIASSHYLIGNINKELYRLKNGSLCSLDKKKYILEEPYTSLFKSIDTLKENPEIKFKTTHKLEIDSNEIRKMAIDKLKNETQGGMIPDINELEEKSKTKLFIREIREKSTCNKIGGKWISDKNQLIKNKIIPNPQIKDYNNKWFDVLKKTEQKINKSSMKILNNLEELVSEKLVTNEENKEIMKYNDNPITNERLDDISKKIKKEITNMISELEKTTIMIDHIHIIDEDDINLQKKLQNQKNNLTKQIQKTENILKKSNN